MAQHRVEGHCNHHDQVGDNEDDQGGFEADAVEQVTVDNDADGKGADADRTCKTRDAAA